MAGVSEAAIAANKAALADAMSNLNQVLAAGALGSAEGLGKAAQMLTNDIVESISHPGRGSGNVRKISQAKRLRGKGAAWAEAKWGNDTGTRAAKGVGARGFHRASAPGDPPAKDTGRLAASWGYDVVRDSKRPYALVGTNVIYAPFLEFGTRHMAPRPYVRPAVIHCRDDIRGQIANATSNQMRLTAGRLQVRVNRRSRG